MKNPEALAPGLLVAIGFRGALSLDQAAARLAATKSQFTSLSRKVLM